MSADDLREVRDDLLARLQSLDEARAEVLERLAELEAEDRIAAARGRSRGREPSDGRAARRSACPARSVRWVGA